MTDQFSLNPARLRGARVLILGLGILNGGVGLARYCARHGAELRITDLRSRDDLAPALAQLNGVDATFVLGQNREEDIDWAEIIFRNPGVVPDSPLLSRAHALDKVIDMEAAFFVRNAPARIYGVTGTKGKTTVATMLHAFLTNAERPIHIAGNMGRSTVDLLDGLTAEDEVVLELSSYQLEGFAHGPGRVRVAIITNLDDDHLDRYGTLDRYARTKARIAGGQAAEDWLVIPRELEDLVERERVGNGRLAVVGRGDARDGRCSSGRLDARLVDRRLVLNDNGVERTLVTLDELPLRGAHNEMNAALAAVAAHLAGRSPAELQRAIPVMTGVPHRFEHVRWLDGVEFINDTAASAPVAVVAAIDALDRKATVLIAGGHDKGADFAPMLRAIRDSGSQLVLLPGTGTDRLVARARTLGLKLPTEFATSMSEAVELATRTARRKGLTTVLLAPGCASFGLFRNEFERGTQFVTAVRTLAPEANLL